MTLHQYYIAHQLFISGQLKEEAIKDEAVLTWFKALPLNINLDDFGRLWYTFTQSQLI